TCPASNGRDSSRSGATSGWNGRLRSREYVESICYRRRRLSRALLWCGAERAVARPGQRRTTRRDPPGRLDSKAGTREVTGSSSMSRSRWHTEFGWGIEFGWHEANAPGPQTEDSVECGFPGATHVSDLGRSDELDLDDVGDIADEGAGRRG